MDGWGVIEMRLWLRVNGGEGEGRVGVASCFFWEGGVER